MATYNEGRSYRRCVYETPIGLAFFNSGRWSDAQTLDHSSGGMRVRSNSNFQLARTVIIQIKNYASNGSCTCNFNGLPIVTLGEVKWCRNITDAAFSYEVGVKYYPPEY